MCAYQLRIVYVMVNEVERPTLMIGGTITQARLLDWVKRRKQVEWQYSLSFPSCWCMRYFKLLSQRFPECDKLDSRSSSRNQHYLSLSCFCQDILSHYQWRNQKENHNYQQIQVNTSLITKGLKEYFLEWDLSKDGPENIELGYPRFHYKSSFSGFLY